VSDATVVGGLFVAVGAALAAGVGWLRWLAKRSESWPSVPGVVRGVEVVGGDSGGAHRKRPSERIRVTYAFSVDGRDHVGDRIAFGDALWGWTRDRAHVGWRMSRYPAGEPVTVYYDPARPDRCTLTRGPDGAPFVPFLAVAGLLVVVGWGAILGWIRVG
jgi:hypothetical protein